MADARRVQSDVCDQLSNFVLPRLVQLDAPLLAVVGGSTGAGKSTLVNSLIGEPVTESGVLRPTTRSPVLVHHPKDAEWFQGDRVLPDLPRTQSHGNAEHAVRLVSSRELPRGIAVLDAPDFDSVDALNRKLASQLLAAADLWLFVTSAARYADQVPWEFLRRAVERDAAVAVVLDRTAPEAVTEIRGHLARMMSSRGLQDAPLFAIPESPMTPAGLLPEPAVRDILAWLEGLGSDVDGRQNLIGQTLDGAIRHNVFRALDVVDALDEQAAQSEQLTSDVVDAYRRSAEAVELSSRDGSLVRGALLTRWQEFVGSGEIINSLEDKSSRLRNRVAATLTAGHTSAADVAAEIETSLTALLEHAAERAADAAAAAWQAAPAGRTLMHDEPELVRAGRSSASRAGQLVRSWQQHVYDLVRAASHDALGVDGLGVAVMVVMLCGLADADTSPGAVGHQMLEGIFGELGLIGLVRDAHADFVNRAAALLEAEQNRYLGVFDAPQVVRERQDSLRMAAREAEYARHISILEGESA